jgi:hypothetical protein
MVPTAEHQTRLPTSQLNTVRQLGLRWVSGQLIQTMAASC